MGATSVVVAVVVVGVLVVASAAALLRRVQRLVEDVAQLLAEVRAEREAKKPLPGVRRVPRRG